MMQTATSLQRATLNSAVTQQGHGVNNLPC